LRERLPPTLQFEAFPGYSTARAHAAASIPSGQDLIVISLGGNDDGDASAARSALIAVARARNPHAAIVWVGPFHTVATTADASRRHDEQAEAQRLHLPRLGVRWVDARPWHAEHRADGVHFTPAGYDTIADAIAKAIRDPTPLRRRMQAAGGLVLAVGLAVAGAASLAFAARWR
jgi:lysophospholipase L1-like esterase